MKQVFNNTNITSIIAFTIIVLSYMYFFMVGSGKMHTTESLQTQIVQGIFGLTMLVAGYFFGSSKKETPKL
jgi:hypothetical protein